MSDKNISRVKSEVKPTEVAIVNKTLYQSMNTLTRQGIIKHVKEETVEIPVIVDEVTKWVTGVNEGTTCEDIIRAILQRETNTFQVRVETVN